MDKEFLSIIIKLTTMLLLSPKVSGKLMRVYVHFLHDKRNNCVYKFWNKYKNWIIELI